MGKRDIRVFDEGGEYSVVEVLSIEDVKYGDDNMREWKLKIIENIHGQLGKPGKVFTCARNIDIDYGGMWWMWKLDEQPIGVLTNETIKRLREKYGNV